MSYYNHNRHPFTPIQWQELKHQALIYKFMTSGIPIPPELIIPIKRSFFLTQPIALGWSSYYQMRYGAKTEDLEPERCRRTDGKKWRCSKEAYPDSKYCERHKHRGKIRSRKLVEIMAAKRNSNSNNNNNNTNLIDINNSDSSCSLVLSASTSSASEPPCPYSLMHPQSSTLSLDSQSCSSADRDYSSSLELRPLELIETKHRGEEEDEGKKSEHCYVLGADFKQQRPVEKRYLFDDWPEQRRETSWMSSEGGKSSGLRRSLSYSKTQLSISVPASLQDFPQ